MELIYGQEKKFVEFIGNLDETDKIAIIAHNDMDGMVSALIAEKIIGKAEIIEFFDYKKDFLLGFVPSLKEKKIDKLICLDLNLENEYLNLKEIEKFADILIIDHHRSKKDLNSERTVFLLTEKNDVASFATYELFTKFQNLSELDFLVAIGVISDHSWDSHMDFISRIEKKYGFSKHQDIWNSKLGKFTTLLSNAHVYFKSTSKPIYFFENLRGIKKIEDIEKLKKYSTEVEEEIEQLENEFNEKKEKYLWGYLYKVATKFKVASIVVSKLSDLEKDKLFIIYGEREGNLIKINARRQDGKLDCSELLKKAVSGLKEGNAGGHIPASGAEIRKEDLDKFKENLIKIMSKI